MGMKGASDYQMAKIPNIIDASGWYDEPGHYYGAVIEALNRGFSPSEAATIGEFAQLPDEDPVYDAMGSVETLGFMGIARDFHAGNPVRIAMQKYLHVLTGSDANEMREYIKCLIKNGNLSLEETGLLIHALQDTYAHSEGDKLYDTGLGHGLRGHLPDRIRDNPTKWKASMNSVGSALASTGHGSLPVGGLNEWAQSHSTTLRGIADRVAREVAPPTWRGSADQTGIDTEARILRESEASDFFKTHTYRPEVGIRNPRRGGRSPAQTDKIVVNLIKKMHKGFGDKGCLGSCTPPKVLAEDTSAEMLTPELLEEDRQGKLTPRLLLNAPPLVDLVNTGYSGL
jgi:hypothetical protein